MFRPDWSYRPYFSLPDDMCKRVPHTTDAMKMVPEMSPLARNYLQDLSLWIDAADEIRAYFEPSDLAKRLLKDTLDEFSTLHAPVLAVHVRRGDNVVDPMTPDKWRYHPPRPLRYYQQALTLSIPGMGSVAAFGDDLEWNRDHIAADWYGDGNIRVKENHPGYMTEPVTDWVDLMVMRRCSRFIISNSTYSWWAAWLSGTNDVIYPWPFHGVALDGVTEPSLMFPAEWERLDHGPYNPEEE